MAGLNKFSACKDYVLIDMDTDSHDIWLFFNVL